ncbi:1359_t:CDS:1, partial [Ambispora leptoticha]
HSTTPDHVKKANPNARHRFYFDLDPKKKKMSNLELEMNIDRNNLIWKL